MHDSHALAAAARRGLDQHRVSEALGVGERIFNFGDAFAIAAGKHRHPRANHDASRARLIAHQPDVTRLGTDEVEAGFSASLREVAILTEEAVAGMNRVGAVCGRRADYRWDVEIAGFGLWRTDTDRLIGHSDVHCVFVGGGEYRDGGYSEFAARANYSNRDGAAIGDE